MADLKQIQFKRSNVPGKRPTAAQLVEGELAINLRDRTLFTRDDQGLVVDLGFAKGGRIDGDVIQVGNYGQTGNYTVSGTITAGDIGARNINAGAGIVSQGDIASKNGVIRIQTGAGKNAHLWFEGDEGGTNKERALIYAQPQTETSGIMIVRVQNGYGAGQPAPTFTFNGEGRFAAPSLIQAPRIVATDVLEATRVDTRQLNTSGKPWQDPNNSTGISYSINDLVSYVPGTGGALALNYVYRGRAMNAGTIWHQILDERSGAEWSLYTGAGPSNKMFSVRSQTSLGDGKFSGSLLVGGSNEYSTLGASSIALGEANTGLRRTSMGYLDLLVNGEQMVRFAHPGKVVNFSTRMYVSVSNAADTSILPPNNTAQVTIDTSLDDNNAGGNGLTLIGYNAAGEYHHYFRGKGGFTVDMWKGLTVNRGGIIVNGDSAFSGIVAFNGSSTLMNIASATNLTTSKNSAQASASAMNAIWVHTPIGPTGGKVALRTFRGGSGDTIWHETVQGSEWRLATGNTDVNTCITVKSNGELTSYAGSIIAEGGSFRSRSNGNTHYWLETSAGEERGVIYAGPNANSVVIRAQRTSDATAQNASFVFFSDGTLRTPILDATRLTSFVMSQPPTSISGIRIEGITTGSEAGLIRGTVDGGSHVAWASRSAAIQLDCPNADTSAYNIWKATKWGSYHLANMDVYGPNAGGGVGNATVRMVLRRGGGGEAVYMWTPQLFTCPAQVNATEFYLTSDIAIKTDIREIESSRENLHKISVKRYAMKDGSNDNAIGVIAQEVELVYPELVINKDDGNKSVNYRGLSTILWKITQEQDIELQDMKARLERLEKLLG